MKRYTPDISRIDEVFMEEDPNGQYYRRYDLIAAGVLVPAPDGVRCTINGIFYNKCFEYNRRIFRCVENRARERVLCIELVDASEHSFDGSTMVQPVRLVTLAGLDAREMSETTGWVPICHGYEKTINGERYELCPGINNTWIVWRSHCGCIASGLTKLFDAKRAAHRHAEEHGNG